MKEVELYRDILTKEEKEYIAELIDDKKSWIYRTTYDQRNEDGRLWAWYDSIKVDFNKLKNYHDFICQNGMYIIGETALNIITTDRQNKSSVHFDNADLSFCTYFNHDFEGGKFIYYDDDKKKYSITPEENLTLKIRKGLYHEVELITSGVRYSLYSFLYYKPKNSKSLL